VRKIPITVSIEKNDLLELQRKARETHLTVQTLIRTLITKQLKKVKK